MTNFMVLEIQHNADGTTAIAPIASYEDNEKAWSMFYSVCSVAVKSDVFEHIVIIMNREGVTLDRKAFQHGQSDFPEVEGGEE